MNTPRVKTSTGTVKPNIGIARELARDFPQEESP